jgi:hypothetical protein
MVIQTARRSCDTRRTSWVLANTAGASASFEMQDALQRGFSGCGDAAL